MGIHIARVVDGIIHGEDFDRVYAPGEKELLTYANYERDGIPLNAVTLADLRRTAEARGVGTGAYAWLASA